jgi:hypothetical protein
MTEIMRRLSGKGTTLNPQFVLDRLQEMVEAGEETPQPSKSKPILMPKLVKGLFSPLNVKLENVRRWNEIRNWGFTESDFANLPAPPPYPDNKFGTVVLVPYLETPLKTYQELMWAMKYEHWLCDERGFCLLWDMLVVCGIPHEPGLKWEVIDMAGGVEWKEKNEVGFKGHPIKLPPPELMPHAGVLAEMAHSPYWARSLYSFVGVPGVWVPGYMRIPKEDQMSPCWIESGEYLKPTFGKHLYFEACTDDFHHSYDHHRRGWRSDGDYMKEGEYSTYAVPVLMK